MPILIDCRLMFYRKAGTSNYTRRLVQALALQSAAVENLVVLMDRRDHDTQWVPPSVQIRRALTPAHHRYESVLLPLELKLWSTVYRLPSSIVHFPDFIACRGTFKKVITIHDLYFMEHPEVMSAEGAQYYRRIRESVQQADAIIAVSAFTRDDILRLLPEVPASKITVVHEAGDIRQDAAHLPQPQHFEPYALFVGTFEPRKNLTTLLHVLRHTPHDLRLVIVGEAGWENGGEPAQLARELGVMDRVQLAGRVSDAELDQLYREARMLVFPSLSEGFGLPVLEAMSRGTPVICSRTGSLPEIAGEAAVLVDPLDRPQLAQHMSHMWTDNGLHADYRARGLQRAAQFSWERAARETMAVYQSA